MLLWCLSEGSVAGYSLPGRAVLISYFFNSYLFRKYLQGVFKPAVSIHGEEPTVLISVGFWGGIKLLWVHTMVYFLPNMSSTQTPEMC